MISCGADGISMTLAQTSPFSAAVSQYIRDVAEGMTDADAFEKASLSHLRILGRELTRHTIRML